MTLDTLMLIICGVTGLLLGWGAHASIAGHAKRVADRDASESPCSTHEGGDESADPSSEILREVMDRLGALTKGVAADVDAHQSRMLEVSQSLQAEDSLNQSEGIVAALEVLLSANEKMSQQLHQAQSQLHQQAKTLQTVEERANTDGLTQLKNRRYFDELLDRRLQLAGTSPTTLMLMDVDHFKQFNDRYGHAAGDEVLRQVAAKLEDELSKLATVTRYGGEEFAIIFDDQTVAQCIEVAERAREVIAGSQIPFDGQMLSVTASAGLANIHVGDTAESFIRRADMALYESKKAGRNCGHWVEGDRPQRISLTPSATPNRLTDATTATPVAAAAGAETPPVPAAPRGSQSAILDLSAGGNELSEMRKTLRMVGVDFWIITARLHAEAQNPEEQECFGQAIQSVARASDRVTRVDERTMLIGMASASVTPVLERAAKIRENVAQAAKEQGLDQGSLSRLSLGVAVAQESEPLSAVVKRSLQAAEAAVRAGVGKIVCAEAPRSRVAAPKA